MNEESFWLLIDSFVKYNDPNAVDEYCNLVVKELELLPNDELKKFFGIFKTKVNELSTVDLSEAIFVVFTGCGDDDFEVCSAGIISFGSQFFKECLDNPEKALMSNPASAMLDRYEPFLAVIHELVTERLGGKERFEAVPDFELDLTFSDRYSENPAHLKAKFPALFKKYWKL